MEKTHWKKFFNYEYLGAYSLDDIKGDLILTIDKVVTEKVTGQSGKKEDCMVCYFTDADKPMILNRTNCKAIEKMYKTPHVEEWKGKRIALFAKMVSAFGDETEALRIRPNIPPQPEVAQLESLRKEAEGLFNAYSGVDKESIKESITEAIKAGKADKAFWESQIKLLKK